MSQKRVSADELKKALALIKEMVRQAKIDEHDSYCRVRNFRECEMSAFASCVEEKHGKLYQTLSSLETIEKIVETAAAKRGIDIKKRSK